MTGQHRVTPLGPRLRRYEDPERSRDVQVRAVVAQLRAVDLPGPRAHFRAELRTQLVAVAPRLVADGLAEQQHAAKTANARPAAEPERRRNRFARPLAVAATLVTVCALLLGGAVWMSKKALPGDTLYGLKRASESVQLHFASNDTDRATDYLHFSQERVSEAQQLLGRASASGTGLQADGISSSTVTLLRSTLDTADKQLVDGWNLLKTQAKNSDSSKPYAVMTGWAPGQLGRLTTLHDALPVGLQGLADKSAAVAQFALNHARENAAIIDKAERTPAPAKTGKTPPRSGTGSATTPRSPATKTPANGATTSRRGHGTTSGSHRSSSSHTTSHRAATPSATATPRALLPSLPSLPVSGPKTPLLSSCGVTVPGVLSIGHCRSHS